MGPDKMCGSSYVMKGELYIVVVNYTRGLGFSHMSEKRLNCLAKKNLLYGVNSARLKSVLIVWLGSNIKFI